MTAILIPKPPVEPILTAPPQRVLTVDTSLTLLVAGYVHLGTPLDLYGYYEDDTIELVDVAFAGSLFSMADLLQPDDFAKLERWCERMLPTPAELAREARLQSRIEDAETDRWFRERGGWPA